MNRDFNEYLKSYRKMIAVLIGTAIISYIAVNYSNISPPIHNKDGILFISLIVEATAIISAYIKMKQKNKYFLIWLSIFFLVAYFSLHSLTTFPIPTSTNGELDVKGFVCTNLAMKIYPDECPFLSNTALKEASFESSRLWQDWSIALIKSSLVILWVLFIWTTSRLIASFTLTLRTKK